MAESGGAFAFDFNSPDSLGLGAMFTGIFDNIITTKDEKQQNANQLALGQYGINAQTQLAAQQTAAQIEASKERNKVIIIVSIILAIMFTLFLIFR